MSELLRICQALRAARERGEPCWLASVVAIDGSAYRRPGARLLFGREGKLAGSVSGGCLDREILRTGAWLCQHGPVIRQFDNSTDEDGAFPRSGCGGRVTLLVEQVTSELGDMLLEAGDVLESERRALLVTITRSASLAPGLGSRWLAKEPSAAPPAWFDELHAEARAAWLAPRAFTSHHERRGFGALLEAIEPSPHCFIFGSGEDAVPLAQLLRGLSWNVSVCVEQERVSLLERFRGLARVSAGSFERHLRDVNRAARPLTVVMSHDYERDRDALGVLLRSRAGYIGMLGPLRRTKRMLDDLGLQRTEDARWPQNLYAPVGLHVGAETPEEIALSIASEMQAVLASASGGSLRERAGAIHQRSELRLLEAEGA